MKLSYKGIILLEEHMLLEKCRNFQQMTHALLEAQKTCMYSLSLRHVIHDVDTIYYACAVVMIIPTSKLFKPLDQKRNSCPAQFYTFMNINSRVQTCSWVCDLYLRGINSLVYSTSRVRPEISRFCLVMLEESKRSQQKSDSYTLWASGAMVLRQEVMGQ